MGCPSPLPLPLLRVARHQCSLESTKNEVAQVVNVTDLGFVGGGGRPNERPAAAAAAWATSARGGLPSLAPVARLPNDCKQARALLQVVPSRNVMSHWIVQTST